MRLLLAAAMILVSAPAYAVCIPTLDRDCPDTRPYEQGYEAGKRDGYRRGLYAREPKPDLYGPSLEGGTKLYPKEPTLGDPRRFRKTDPRTCYGMLCD